MKENKQYTDPKCDNFAEFFAEGEKALRDAVEQPKDNENALRAARFQLVKVFCRIARMQEQIDEAYAGRAFLLGCSPMAPANIQRFRSFLARHRAIVKLMKQAMDMWVLTCGLRWHCDSASCAAQNCQRSRKRPLRRKSTAKIE
jgi:hypothetical protein